MIIPPIMLQPREVFGKGTGAADSECVFQLRLSQHFFFLSPPSIWWHHLLAEDQENPFEAPIPTWCHLPTEWAYECLSSKHDPKALLYLQEIRQHVLQAATRWSTNATVEGTPLAGWKADRKKDDGDFMEFLFWEGRCGNSRTFFACIDMHCSTACSHSVYVLS